MDEGGHTAPTREQPDSMDEGEHVPPTRGQPETRKEEKETLPRLSSEVPSCKLRRLPHLRPHKVGRDDGEVDTGPGSKGRRNRCCKGGLLRLEVESRLVQVGGGDNHRIL